MIEGIARYDRDIKIEVHTRIARIENTIFIDLVNDQWEVIEINKGGWTPGGPKGGYFAPWDNPKLEPGPRGESLPMRLGRETVKFIEA